jgi:hypothetical protein
MPDLGDALITQPYHNAISIPGRIVRFDLPQQSPGANVCIHEIAANLFAPRAEHLIPQGENLHGLGHGSVARGKKTDLPSIVMTGQSVTLKFSNLFSVQAKRFTQTHRP